MNRGVVILLGILFFACAAKELRVVESLWNNGNPKVVKYYKGEEECENLVRIEECYEDGQVRLAGSVQEGQRNGLWKYFFEDGKIWTEAYYIHGELDGAYTVYYKKGAIRYRGVYRNGQREGEWLFFDEEGRQIKSIDYSQKID